MDSPLVVVLLGAAASVIGNLLTAAIPNVEKLPAGIASLFLAPAHRQAFRDKWASHLAAKRITAIGILIWLVRLVLQATVFNLESGRVRLRTIGTAVAGVVLFVMGVGGAVAALLARDAINGVPLVFLATSSLILTLSLLKGGTVPIGVSAISAGIAAVIYGAVIATSGGILLGAGGGLAGVGAITAGIGIIVWDPAVGGGIAVAGLAMMLAGPAELANGDLIGGFASIAIGAANVTLGLAVMGARMAVLILVLFLEMCVGGLALALSLGWQLDLVGVAILVGGVASLSLTATMTFAPRTSLEVATFTSGAAMVIAGIGMLLMDDVAPGVGMLGLGLGALAVHSVVLPELPVYQRTQTGQRLPPPQGDGTHDLNADSRPTRHTNADELGADARREADPRAQRDPAVGSESSSA